MTSTLIYKGASNSRFALYLVFRAGVVIICVSAGRYFNANPVGISIVFGIALLYFLAIGDEEVHVYNDKVVRLDNSLLSLLLGKRKKEFPANMIKKASLDDESPGISGLGLITIIKFLYPKTNRKERPPVYLELTNGESATITTDLEYDIKQKIVESINKLVE